jgi:hypothetical protein
LSGLEQFRSHQGFAKVMAQSRQHFGDGLCPGWCEIGLWLEGVGVVASAFGQGGVDSASGQGGVGGVASVSGQGGESVVGTQTICGKHGLAKVGLHAASQTLVMSLAWVGCMI